LKKFLELRLVVDDEKKTRAEKMGGREEYK
jgi:hypothetical protein